MFDVKALDTRTASEAGVDMPVLHPRDRAPIIDTETGANVTIRLRGRNSDTFRTQQRELNKRRAEFQSRGVIMTDDDFMRERVDMVCACTLGWTFSQMDGAEFPYTPDNVRRFWADRRWTWLLDNAWAFLTEEGNFLSV